MSKNTYIKKVVEVIKGTDNPQTRAEKMHKKLQSGIAVQLSMKVAEKIDLEEAVTEAEEKLSVVLLNEGQDITNTNVVIQKYLDARVELQKAEEALKNHDLVVEWLQDAEKELS